MDDIKMQVIDEMQKNLYVFKKVSNERFRIRCPYCGDSSKNPNDAHCYIKCSQDPSEPILYICFLCNKRGIVGKEFLTKLGLNPSIVSKFASNSFGKHNTISNYRSKNIDIKELTGNPVYGSPQIRYIEDRLGTGLTLEDYDKFKIIWDMNLIYPHVADSRVRNTLPNNRESVSFLSDDRSTLLIRNFNDKDGRWRKSSIFNIDTKSFYTIKTVFDLFTTDDIYVNIGEGVFDILSAYKNFNDGPNSAFIAVLGSDYVSGIDYAIAKGILGSNVIIKIFMDSNIDEKVLISSIKKYKPYFKKILVYKNINNGDIGHKIEEIKLVEKRV